MFVSVSVSQVQKQLDTAVAGDCPFCGEFMIRSITEAYIEADDKEMESWRIGVGGGR